MNDDNYDTSEDWDWSEERPTKITQPKQLTAKERFEQVLLKQKVQEFQFKMNPLFNAAEELVKPIKPLPPTPPPQPPVDGSDESYDYAQWKPYEPEIDQCDEESTEYEVYSDEEYVYESVSDSTISDEWDSEEMGSWEAGVKVSPKENITIEQLQQELRNLRANLDKVTERSNIVLAEREMLSAQLDDCEDVYDRLLDEVDQLEDEIDAKEHEIATRKTMVFKLQALRMKQEEEEDLIDQLVDDIDEFSQATQILMNHGLYFDMEDLIRKHFQKCDSSDKEKIKKSIIAEANIVRDQRMKSAVETLKDYLSPRL